MLTKPAPFLLLLVVLSSCKASRFIYNPSPPNSPLFEKKGDNKLSAYYSGGDAGEEGSNQGYDLQGGYAITNHFAVTAGYFSREERDLYPLADSVINIFKSSTVKYKRHIGDFGIGYFMPMDKNYNGAFSFYAGIGFGKFYIADNGKDDGLVDYTRFHDSKITKYYVQPSFYFHAGQYLRVLLAGRFSLVHYNDISTSYSSSELDYFDLSQLSGKTFGFYEPTLSLQYIIPKCKWLKVETYVTGASNLKDVGKTSSESEHAKTRGLNASIGLTFDFSKLKGK